MKKTEFTYPSSDGKTQIHAIRWEPEEQPIAVLQISHGMVEFIDRYSDFASWLAARGFVVVGNDHLGHGESVQSREDWGYFSEEGDRHVLDDLHRLTFLTKDAYPGLPYFLLGHSMGSFFARRYLCEYGGELTGGIICGTGQQPVALLRAGKMITRLLAAFRGWRHRSKFVDSMAFGNMNKPFEPARTSKDWLCRDEAVVDAYRSDERNSFLFTLNGYYHSFENMLQTQKAARLAGMPKDLPVLFIAGESDPVGEMGKGVEKAAETFRQTGLQDVTCILYPDFRHEILNEIDKERVYADVESWMREKLP